MSLLKPGAAVLAVGLLAVLATPWPAAAQLSRPDQAILERQLRAAQGRALSDPEGAARDLGRLHHDLRRDNGGVSFGPDAARIDRQLRTFGDRQVRRPDVARRRVPGTPAEPPSSVEPGTSGIPSVDQNVTLARSLLDRADEGIAEGRTDSARSDLALVQESLTGLKGLVATAPLAARAAALQSRLDGRQR